LDFLKQKQKLKNKKAGRKPPAHIIHA
jgi:hypothetical protein